MPCFQPFANNPKDFRIRRHLHTSAIPSRSAQEVGPSSCHSQNPEPLPLGRFAAAIVTVISSYKPFLQLILWVHFVCIINHLFIKLLHYIRASCAVFPHSLLFLFYSASLNAVFRGIYSCTTKWTYLKPSRILHRLINIIFIGVGLYLLSTDWRTITFRYMRLSERDLIFSFFSVLLETRPPNMVMYLTQTLNWLLTLHAIFTWLICTL